MEGTTDTQLLKQGLGETLISLTKIEQALIKVGDYMAKAYTEEKPRPVAANRSAEIKNLAIALAKAQGDIEHAAKDSTNPHFNKTYADLASVWTACRDALTKNGLSVVQLPEVVGRGNGSWVEVKTMLLHASGEYMESTIVLPVAAPGGAQQIGSAITYARRYALSAMAGVAPNDDDDGNSAQGQREERKAPPAPAKKGVAMPPKDDPANKSKPAPAAAPAAAPAVTGDGKAKITTAQLAQITKAFKATKPAWTVDQLREFSRKAFGHDSAQDLTNTQFQEMMNGLTMTFDGALAVFAAQPPEQQTEKPA